MSTPNFRTQDYFDLYVAGYERPSDEDIKAWEEETGEKFDDEFEQQIFYDNVISEFEYAKKSAEKEFKKDLLFHDVTLLDGYYTGIQMFVEPKGELKYCDIDEMDNDDTRYHYDMCRSETLRKYDIERRFIDKKLMPYIAKQIGMRRLNCVGVFSNGEAVYEWA